MDSQLSQLKSPADGVCQAEASPGMSGQPKARPLQWGPEGENSLIKNCLARPRLGPSHPHANNLNTLESMVESGHLCAMWAIQKPPQHATIVRNQLDLPLGSKPTESFTSMPTEASKQNLSYLHKTREFS